MAWRDMFLRHFGPGELGGITLGNWLRLLRDNRFALAPSCLLPVVAMWFPASQTPLISCLENWRFRRRWKDVTVAPPLFVLGHWRGGTTHLHNLLTVDERFAFPNNYQTLFPHTFLTTEAVTSRLMSFFLPRRRPMDNI